MNSPSDMFSISTLNGYFRNQMLQRSALMNMGDLQIMKE